MGALVFIPVPFKYVKKKNKIRQKIVGGVGKQNMIESKGLQNYVESIKYSKHDHLHDDTVRSTNKK